MKSRESMNADKLMIRQPRFILWIGVINNLFFLWLVIHMTFFHTTQPEYGKPI